MTQPIKPIRIALRTCGDAVAPVVIRQDIPLGSELNDQEEDDQNETGRATGEQTETHCENQLRMSTSAQTIQYPGRTGQTISTGALGLASPSHNAPERHPFQSTPYTHPATVNPQHLHHHSQSAYLPAEVRMPPAQPIQPASVTPSNPSRPPTQNQAQTQGQSQRQSYQHIQRLDATASQHETELTRIRNTLADVVADVGVLTGHLEKQAEQLEEARREKEALVAQMQEMDNEQTARIADLEEMVADLEDEVYGEGDGGSGGGNRGTATSQEKRALAVYLKRVLEQLHGERPPLAYPDKDESWPQLTTADGAPAGPAMRWDYSKAFREEPNISQTRLLLKFVKEKPDAVDMPNDTPMSMVLPYSTHVNVYSKALSDIFKQYRAATKTQALKKWKDRKPEVLREIESLLAEDQGDEPLPLEQRRAQAAELQKMVDKMDGQAAAVDGDKKGNVRSKCQSMVQRVKKIRPTSPYSAVKFEFLEDVYCMPPPTLVKQPNGQFKAYATDMSAVYSDQFIEMFQLIWESEDPTGTSSHSPIINDPPIGYEPQPPSPYWATQFGQLHLNPQRWMFNDTFLASHAPTSPIWNRIVDVNEPTSPEDVKLTQWYLMHPQTLGRTPKGAAKSKTSVPKDTTKSRNSKKRVRSVSIAASEMGPTSTPSPGSYGNLPPSSDGSQPMYKRIKSAMKPKGRPAILDEGDENDESAIDIDPDLDDPAPLTPVGRPLPLPPMRANSRDMLRLSGPASSKTTPRTPVRPSPRQHQAANTMTNIFPSHHSTQQQIAGPSKQRFNQPATETRTHMLSGHDSYHNSSDYDIETDPQSEGYARSGSRTGYLYTTGRS
ncbi:hypothetical protein FFLO_03187 [Filobasidium floriforme]|uniref:Uncharacterized protein n=1 Tax=Filobasidium floriforme TaxID=5210 RepID=A0A8K0JLE2_9TREE|nr:uncharacterized protein HD553DRAFT_344310 [Filobasidium floriforme]KAG7548895.1 hypothetical protein FFLO_03187 [Filobasidium floriforme]KAH8081107.1 hypothetical protein HD553DRAFT_344310 [Filobasidium floriforme]